MTTRTSDSKVLQNISYTYDPTGNITLVNDSSIATVFSNNQQVEPKQKFTYDALYRLTEAEGREHTALNNPDYYKDTNAFKQSSFISITDANDSNRLANYTRRYTYDKAGNMLTVRHIAANSARSFTRTIRLDEDSNRWLPANMGNNLTIGNYYDANGNIKELETLQELNWNYRDNISSGITVQRPGGISDGEFYMYDAAGQRVRKKYRQVINALSTRYTEKVYVGNVEVKRIRTYTTGSGYTTTLRRTTLNIMDDARRIARVYNWTIDSNLSEVNSSNELYTNMTYYQYGNHLDSASLELSTSAQVISYEEYFPYGDTSFIAGNSQKGVKIKDYRFTGKEKDDVTGLYYYGARYYASWLGRWMSADPLFRENAGVYERPKDKDSEAAYWGKVYGEGLNLYCYVKGNPVILTDPNGCRIQNNAVIDMGGGGESELPQERDWIDTIIDFVAGGMDYDLESARQRTVERGELFKSGGREEAEAYSAEENAIQSQILEQYGESGLKEYKRGSKAGTIYGAKDGSTSINTPDSLLEKRMNAIKDESDLYKLGYGRAYLDGLGVGDMAAKLAMMIGLAYSLKLSVKGIKGSEKAIIPKLNEIDKLKAFFGKRTMPEIEKLLTEYYGEAKSIRPHAKTFYDSETKTSFNLHKEPGHMGGKPHIDIRQRGSNQELKFLLKEK